MPNHPASFPWTHSAHIGPQVPRRGNVFTVGLSWLVFRLFGWKVTGAIPDAPKAVIIVAPHTSNWDGIMGLFGIQLLRLNVRFFGKATLFRGPLGWLLTAIGGIPLARTGKDGMVEHSVTAFQQEPPFWLAMAPEGTRKQAPTFKQGFYHIARAAQVPIIVVGFNFNKGELRILGTCHPGEDKEKDLEAILALYQDAYPKNPENLSIPLRKIIQKKTEPKRG